MKCNLCNSDDSDIIYGYTRLKKNNVLKCKNCGLVFLELNRTKENVESYYEKEYREIDELPKQTPEEMFNDPVIRNDCDNRLEWIEERYGDLKNKRILEIGSSSGYFLDVMRTNGANVEGIELTKNYSDYSKKLGFKIYNESIENLNLNEEFDLIIMFHTLEHVFDPMSVIRAVNRALKRDGVFMGESPNQKDWRIEIFNNEGVKRFHYDFNHYYYYSPDIIRRYLKICGFKEERLETVERYNSLEQLRRILTGEYEQKSIEEILKRDIFAKPEDDVRIPKKENKKEIEFNKMFEIGVNNRLMGNCLRWFARK